MSWQCSERRERVINRIIGWTCTVQNPNSDLQDPGVAKVDERATCWILMKLRLSQAHGMVICDIGSATEDSTCNIMHFIRSARFARTPLDVNVTTGRWFAVMLKTQWKGDSVGAMRF